MTFSHGVGCGFTWPVHDSSVSLSFPPKLIATGGETVSPFILYICTITCTAPVPIPDKPKCLDLIQFNFTDFGEDASLLMSKQFYLSRLFAK